MYENLIETLRFCAKNGDCHDCPYEKPCAGTMGDGLYCEAADAIEELAKFIFDCIACDDCPVGSKKCKREFAKCKDAALCWLKQEADHA